MRATDVQGKRFSVIGGARSGLAVASLLKSQGAVVFLSEKAPAERLQNLHTELKSLQVPYEFGGNTARILDADVVVLSPGVPSDIPVVRDAIAQGVTVVSELEVASWFCRGPIIGITGTNGKTTTTALTGRIFSDAGLPSAVAGNIGTAFSQVVSVLPEGGTTILEVSSFQLDHIVSFRPRVAVLLNITPDHLDRYEHSFAKYIASKCRIFENQKSGDTLVYNWDDEVTRTAVRSHAVGGMRTLPFTQSGKLGDGASVSAGHLIVSLDGKVSEVVPMEEITIKGAHNLYNAMAAALTARVLDVPLASLRATLRNFRGVEHRLEFVRELNGVTYVNDSKGTNVDAVWYALQSFDAPIILLLGGRDKGNDYSRLHDLVRRNVRTVVAIGESAEKVRSSFAQIVPVTVATNMEEAVQSASHLALRGDVVLLSPACASFDWFDNYEHRGQVFKQLVWNLETMK